MYDVIIVGAGIAGCRLAGMLNDTELNVLVLEKERKITLKDSGIVSSDFLEYFPQYLVAKNIDAMSLVSPSGKEFIISADEPFAHILKREEFSGYLRKKISIKYENASGIKVFRDSVSVLTEKQEYYECRLVVGCDGANSIVRKDIGIEKPKMCTGVFSRGARKYSPVKVYLNKYFSPDFFAWQIPLNGEHGLLTAVRPNDYLKFFEKSCDLAHSRLYAAQIPIGLQRSFADRCILIGDAASQVKPATGGGIMFSLKAAGHASHVIQHAFRKNRFDAAFLRQYERRWYNDFGAEIRRQLFFRNAYRKLTNQQAEKLLQSFGPRMENMGSFDYDKMSKLIWKMPKLKLLRYLPWLLQR